MTVFHDVRALIDHLAVRQHANHKTRELAGSNGFERRKDVCSMCFPEKLVIRRVK